jgi:hypothetical protein
VREKQKKDKFMKIIDYEDLIIKKLKELFKNNGIYDEKIFKLKNDKKYYYVNCFKDFKQQGNHISFSVNQKKDKPGICIKTDIDFEREFKDEYLQTIENELDLFHKCGHDRQFTFLSKQKNYNSPENKRWAYDSFIIIYNILADKFKVKKITENNINTDDSPILNSNQEIKDIQEDTLSKYFDNPEQLTDGEKKYIQSIRYERKPENRRTALKMHGTICKACEFDFNDFYGEDLAKNFIEVHHINPVSEGLQKINPEIDLIPLCSNCHSMIHREVELPTSFFDIENRDNKKYRK